MQRHPPDSHLSDTLFPCTPLFPSPITPFLLPASPQPFARSIWAALRSAPQRACQSRLACRCCLAKPACPPKRSAPLLRRLEPRSEGHTSELQSLMRTPYGVFCSKTNIECRL